MNKLNVTVDFSAKEGRVRPMHAVNNGPICPNDAGDQMNDNYESYKRLAPPYARNHDAGFCAEYGGEHTVDVHAIFPDFDADPNDPASYDFVPTDRYVAQCMQVTEVFYRLGSKIEHGVKKYGTLPPKDFKKWAVICEHIIRHYTEGWANGFHHRITYWEIWNEPDLDWDDSPNKRTWGGTAAQFYELYVTAATHLKRCFPHLKIGGPAIAGAFNTKWICGFLDRLTQGGDRVPLDFFSWHTYTDDPRTVTGLAKNVRDLLDKYGYTSAESICNEWNYCEDWIDRFPRSLNEILTARGGAMCAAFMAEAHKAGIDMLMYYDARPCGFNGLFDDTDRHELSAYYSLQAFGKLYKLGTACRTEEEGAEVYSLAATDGKNCGAMVAVYSPDYNFAGGELHVTFKGAAAKTVQVYVTDKYHSFTYLTDVDPNKGFTARTQPSAVYYFSLVSRV